MKQSGLKKFNMPLFYCVTVFLFLSFNCLFSLGFSRDLHYTIQPIVEEKKLKIELFFQANEEGITEIDIPISWTGQPFEEIVNLEFFLNEKKLEITNSSLNSIIILHNPYEEIKIKYDVINTSEKQDIHSAYFQEDNFFRFTGVYLSIAPKGDPYEKISIFLNWKDVPISWTIANSFGIDEVSQEIIVSLYSLRMGLFIGGKLDISSCGDLQNAPYVAIKNPELISTPRLISLLQTIVASQRLFWNDEDFSHFIIVISPSDDDQSIYAEAKLNAFIVFFPSISDDDDEEWKLLSWVLTHEHFHTWNPFKMIPTLPENFDCLAWFTEGFTEYYTAVLSYRTGLLTVDSSLQEINNFLYHYNTSPVRNATNAQFQEERWKDNQMQLLAYQRGFLLALLWDSKIRQRTAEKYSLDDVMRDLFQRVKETGNPVIVATIEDVVGKYLGHQEAHWDIQNYIVNGHTIVPTNFTFLGLLKMNWIENIGFNLYQTQEKGIIKGVTEGSFAFRAGLRNGQKFKGLFYDKELICVLMVDGLTENTISYTFNTDRRLPHYILPLNN